MRKASYEVIFAYSKYNGSNKKFPFNKVGRDDGINVGLFVSPGFVGADVVGVFEGRPVGSEVGALLVGLTVG